MNYFLMLIILALCGAGYYEYAVLQQQNVADQQQIGDLSGKLDTLQSDNKKLEDDETQLKKSADDATAEAADLTKQVQDAQNALAAAKAQAVAQAKASKPATTAPTAATPPTSNLGTISALNGKTYQNCQLLNVKAEGIVVSDADGITEISYSLLPPDLQKRFGYDPSKAAALTEAQIEYQEEQRKAAAQATAN